MENSFSQPQRYQKYQKYQKQSYLVILTEYLRLRLRQIFIFVSLFSRFAGEFSSNTKALLVRNMYWGRGSLYKGAFHLIVIAMTFIALVWGLGPRFLVSQRDSITATGFSSRFTETGLNTFDNDLEFQLAKLTPSSEINADGLFETRVVVAGESLESIVKDINAQIEPGGTPLNTDILRWANDIPSGKDNLAVGQAIRIPWANGVLYKVKPDDTVDKVLAKVKLDNKEANLEDFRNLNEQFIREDGSLIADSTILLPNASIVPIVPPVTRPRATTPGRGVIRVGQNGPVTPQVPVGQFVNPLQRCNYSFSRGFRANHTGVDLATNSGCEVVAAASGTVVRAGGCSALGYCVQISHANGLSTIYGHGNGVFYVSAGQQVVAGQKIMQSGCSGRCYGPHVHISIAANGNDVYGCYSCRINPANYIKY